MRDKRWRRISPRATTGRSATRPGPSRALRPGLEPVEPRQLLSTTSFINEYAVPTPSAGLGDIISGPGGQLWFTEAQAGKIGSIDPTSHAIVEYTVPNSVSPRQITLGRDGNLWFTTAGASIGEFNPSTKGFSFTPTPTTGPGLAGITAGLDGNVWFAESSANQIGFINPSTHAVTEIPIPSAPSGPNQIVTSTDGKIWFTQAANAIGELDPATRIITEINASNSQSSTSSPTGIVAGPNGSIYFTDGACVGEIFNGNPYAVDITTSGHPGLMTIDPAGLIWATEYDLVDRFGPSAQFARFPTPSNNGSGLGGAIALGPDGNIWFTEPNTNQVAQLLVNQSPAPTQTQVSSVGSNLVHVGQIATFEASVTSPDPGTPTGTITFTLDGTAQPAVSLAHYDGKDFADFTTPPLTSTGFHTISAVYDGQNGFLSSSGSSSVYVQLAPDPASTIHEYDVPPAPPYTIGNPGPVATGPDGKLWFSDGGQLASFDPATQTLAQTLVPAPTSVDDLVAGPDGKLWFTSGGTDQIGSLDPTTHAFTVDTTPTNGSDPAGLIDGPDGNLWFTEGAGQIGSINPTTHAITEYQIPTAGAGPGALAVGPDGNLWLTELGAGAIARFELTTHQFRTFPLPAPYSTPSSITTGPDGSLWVTDSSNNQILRFDLATDTFHEYTSSTLAGPTDITAGPGGNLWFVESSELIGSINPATGSIREYSFSGSGQHFLNGLAVGPDGNLWFAEPAKKQIGQFSPAANATTTVLTGPASPPAAGQSTSFIAVVITADGQAPGGTVTFSLDGKVQAPVALTLSNGHWQAVLTTSGLTPGVHTVSASYGGDTQHGASASAVVATRVAPAQPTPSTTQLSGTPDPVIAGQAVSFTAVISGSGQATPTGTVTFVIDGQALPSVSIRSIDGKAVAVLTDASLAAGPHTTTAIYSGDTDTAPSNSNTVAAHVDPTRDGLVSFQGIPIPTAGSRPAGITFGPDGNLWFTESNAGKIASINPVTRAIIEYATPQGLQPYDITLGPDGNLWFTDDASDVGVFSIATHGVTVFFVPAPQAGTSGITAGPDGKLWFTESGADKIGSIDPTTHAITEYPVPAPGGFPNQIVTGSDGNLWFTETSGEIGEFNPTTHTFPGYPIVPPYGGATGITSAPDGSLWFVEDDGKIGSINPVTHVIGEFAIPDPSSYPQSIVTGPDGTLWFGEPDGRKFGTIDPKTHAITEFDIPAQLFPAALVPGPGGTVWFTSTESNQIGRVSLGACLPAAPIQLAASTNPAPIGQAVTVTAIVTGAHGEPPTGSVTFTVDGRAMATTALSPSGDHSQATLTLPALSVGAHSIVASYGGDTNFAGSSTAPLLESVAPHATATVLVAAPNPTVAGQGVLLDAVVVSPSGVPGGTVSFVIDGQVQPPVPVTIVNGLPQAMLVNTSLTPGGHAIAAVFSGATTFGPSVSNATLVTVQPPDGPLVLSVAGVSTGRQISGLALTFSAPLDPSSAQNPANYRIVSETGHRLLVRRAIYSPGSRTVELLPAGRLNMHVSYRVTVVGTAPSGVRNASGVLLDGGRTGHPGSDATLTLTPGTH